MDNKPTLDHLDGLTDNQKMLIQRSAHAQFVILSKDLDVLMNRTPDSGDRYYYERGEVCESLALRSALTGVGPIVGLPTKLTSLGLAELMNVADEKWRARKDSLTLSTLSSFFENQLTKRATIEEGEFGKCVRVMEYFSDLWDVEIIPGELDIYGSKAWFQDKPYFFEVSGIRQCLEDGVSSGYLRKIYTKEVLENISSHLFDIVKRLVISTYNSERMAKQSTSDDLKFFTAFLLGRECEDLKLASTLGLVGYLKKIGAEIPGVGHEEIQRIDSLHVSSSDDQNNDLIGLGLSALKKQALEDMSNMKVRVNPPRSRLI